MGLQRGCVLLLQRLYVPLLMDRRNAGMNLVRNAGMSQDRCANRFLQRSVTMYPSNSATMLRDRTARMWTGSSAPLSVFPTLSLRTKRSAQELMCQSVIQFQLLTVRM